ncbi:alkaline shock response membrane anchor protein AmaP [Streptomyces sp. NBC_01439]|uniref:alkaline shock response membrane anchor protein AmaP n=1 Tax=Streptomyces sp. NBC_01439 TaxID=2903867 RepID=UPI002E292829|nr:alkaline shock response membrane anchor protein AmaP [Streptomyces sp. NBC_01439]
MINRVLLALTGIVLLGAGILVLAGGFNLYQRWQVAPPDGWPLTDPYGVPLDDTDRTRWTDQDWWWPAVIAALALITLLALWWLLAQLRRTHPGNLPVGAPTAVDGVELREHALSDALAADTRHLTGVHEAHARMAGSSRHPEAHLDLTLAPDSDPATVLADLCDGPLDQARQSLGRPLPARARLQVSPHKARRAS